MEILKKNGNGSYHMPYKALAFVITFLVIFSSVIVFASTNKSDIAYNRANIMEIKDDYVSKEIYENDIGYIKEGIKEIRESIKKEDPHE